MTDFIRRRAWSRFFLCQRVGNKLPTLRNLTPQQIVQDFIRELYRNRLMEAWVREAQNDLSKLLRFARQVNIVAALDHIGPILNLEGA